MTKLQIIEYQLNKGMVFLFKTLIFSILQKIPTSFCNAYEYQGRE